MTIFGAILFASTILTSCAEIKSDSEKIALDLTEKANPKCLSDVNKEIILIEDKLKSQGNRPLSAGEKLKIIQTLRRKMAENIKARVQN